jgi:tetratricopeptide (TPR) repeat protein
MSDLEAAEQLEYFIAHVRLLLDGRTMEGLDVWAGRFSELRQISEFDLCQQLANAIRTADLPKHGIGIVRYGEGWLYDRMGRWREAITAYRAALEAFRHAGIPLDTTLLMQIGSVYQDRGEWPAAREAYDQALAAASDQHARALVLNDLAGLVLVQGDLDAAEQHYTTARNLLRDRDQRNFAAATHGLAAVLRDKGRFQESQDLQLECLSIFQSIQDTHGVGNAIGGIATTYLYAGHYAVAIHNYEIALAVFLESSDPANTARTLANLALAHQKAGNYENALDYLLQAIEGYREVHDKHGEAVALVNLVRLHHENDNREAVLAAATVAKVTCEEYGFPQELLRLPAD